MGCVLYSITGQFSFHSIHGTTSPKCPPYLHIIHGPSPRRDPHTSHSPYRKPHPPFPLHLSSPPIFRGPSSPLYVKPAGLANKSDLAPHEMCPLAVVTALCCPLGAIGSPTTHAHCIRNGCAPLWTEYTTVPAGVPRLTPERALKRAFTSRGRVYTCLRN